MGSGFFCLPAAASSAEAQAVLLVAPKAPVPVAEPTPEVLVEPLFFPQSIATTSQLIPSYSMVATPQYAPQMAYAAPATTAYAQQYAAPATTAYSTGVGGYPMGTMS